MKKEKENIADHIALPTITLDKLKLIKHPYFYLN
jgi:hypothetical protein